MQVQVAPTPRQERVLPCHRRTTLEIPPGTTPGGSPTTIVASVPTSRHIPGVGTESAHLETLEQEEADQAILEAELLIARRELRMTRCGHCYEAENAKGEKYKWEYLCGMWREGCARCLKERTIKFRNRGQRILHELGDRLRIRQLSVDDSKDLREDLSPDKYFRLPTDEGEILFYDGDVLDVPGNLDWDDLDWEDLCKTPGRKRASGKLSAPPPPPPEPDELDPFDRDDLMDLLGEKADLSTVPVTITPRFPHVMSNLGSDCPFTRDQLWNAATYQTSDLDPSYDVKEIEIATRERMDIYKKLIIRHGGAIVHSMRRKATVKLNMYERWDPLQIKPDEYDKIVGTVTPTRPPEPPGMA